MRIVDRGLAWFLWAGLLSALASGCSSIGHQQFYALEPTRDLVLRNHAIYRAARPGELRELEAGITWMAVEEIELKLQGMYRFIHYSDDSISVRSLASLYPDQFREIRTFGEVESTLTNEALMLSDAGDALAPDDTEGQEQHWQAVEAAWMAAEKAQKAREAAQRSLLQAIEQQSVHTDPEAHVVSQPLESILVGLSGYDGELDAGDIVLLQSDDADSAKEADVFTLSVSSPGARPQTFQARSSSSLPEREYLEGNEWLELIITKELQDSLAEQDGAEADEQYYSSYTTGTRVHASLTPQDAAIPYRLVSPGVHTANGEKIEPGLPFTLIANRLFLAEDGDDFFPWDTGEIAVVVSVAEGGGESRSFLAAYHDDVSTPSFVPFWGAILYSTTSWTGEPITIKIQVFDLDEEENATLSAVFESALGTVGALTPGLESGLGIAGAIADTLTTNNTDDEILRFELTFVHNTDNAATETLVPRSRSYLIISPVAGTIDPQRVEVTDQWELQPSYSKDWQEQANPLATKWSGSYEEAQNLAGPPSYITISASDSIVIPEALFAARQAEFNEHINLRNTVSGNAAANQEQFQQSLKHLTSAAAYTQHLRDLLAFIEHGKNAPLDWERLQRLSTAIGESEPLSDADKGALLLVARARIREVAEAADWPAVTAACAIRVVAVKARADRMAALQERISGLSDSATLDAEDLEALQSLTADVRNDAELRDVDREALFTILTQWVDRETLGYSGSWQDLHLALPDLIKAKQAKLAAAAAALKS